MSKNNEEVKIAEKVKFWEEQDQINKELIPRVIKNHEMITALTEQSERQLHQAASMQDEIEHHQRDMERMDTKTNEMKQDLETIKGELSAEKKSNQELKAALTKSESQLKELERFMNETDGGAGHKKKDVILIIGIVAALFMSISGMIF